MTVDTNTMISITEANQNFSKVARVVDEHGTAVILKNNVPKYCNRLWQSRTGKNSIHGGRVCYIRTPY